jgi:hypothetical protein
MRRALAWLARLVADGAVVVYLMPGGLLAQLGVVLVVLGLSTLAAARG